MLLAQVMGPAADIKSRLGELDSLSWEVEIRTRIFKNGAQMGTHEKQADWKRGEQRK